MVPLHTKKITGKIQDGIVNTVVIQQGIEVLDPHKATGYHQNKNHPEKEDSNVSHRWEFCS